MGSRGVTLPNNQFPPDFPNAQVWKREATKAPIKRDQKKSRIFRSVYVTKFGSSTKDEGNSDNEEKQKDCGVFVAGYAEILKEGLEVHSCGFDAESQCARYASLLCHYEVRKANEAYTSDNDDPPRPKNSYLQSIDESSIVTLE
ncbi:hypothetical protein BC332_03215 [Capsicum chinense]|nr:hypothetical protein BC332_03215 [Capsicum chinense]